MTYFQKSLRIAPNQPRIHSCIGALFLDIGKIDESLAHLQKAIEIEPRFLDAHYNLGTTYLHMGKARQAITQYQIALEIDANDTQALNNLAWILATWPDASTRDGAKAVEVAERANILTRGDNPIANATLAAAYAEAGRLPDAVKTGRRAEQLAAAEGDTARVDFIRGQIKAYQSGSAFRDRRFAQSAP